MSIFQNSQVSAAIITAASGILGIFINIAINFYFRKRDYSNKIKMQNIENLDTYYLPLNDKVEYIIGLLKKLPLKSDTDMYSILNIELETINAPDVELFKESINDLKKTYFESFYKYQENYELFKCYREVKKKVLSLDKYIQKQIIDKNKFLALDFLNELENLSWKIQCCEIHTMNNNFVLRIKEYIKLCKNKNKKFNIFDIL